MDQRLSLTPRTTRNPHIQKVLLNHQNLVPGTHLKHLKQIKSDWRPPLREDYFITPISKGRANVLARQALKAAAEFVCAISVDKEVTTLLKDFQQWFEVEGRRLAALGKERDMAEGLFTPTVDWGGILEDRAFLGPYGFIWTL